MRIAIHGYGRMGEEVEKATQERGHTISRIFTHGDPVTAEGLTETETVIDFSTPDAVIRLIDAASNAGVAVVSGTTGWDPAELRDRIESSGIGFTHAPNFSPGAAVLFAAAREAARVASTLGGFEAGIHERHHIHKKDSPSGTAARLESEVRRASGKTLDPVTTASRVGYEAGLHTLFLDGEHDLVEITHRARGRGGFATGAVIAAELLNGRHGFLTFEELLEGQDNDDG